MLKDPGNHIQDVFEAQDKEDDLVLGLLLPRLSWLKAMATVLSSEEAMCFIRKARGFASLFLWPKFPLQNEVS